MAAICASVPRSADLPRGAGRLFPERSALLLRRTAGCVQQVLRKHRLSFDEQTVATLSFGKNFDSVKEFRHAHCGGEELARLLLRHHSTTRARAMLHELRDHIRVETSIRWHLSSSGFRDRGSGPWRNLQINAAQAAKRRWMISPRFSDLGSVLAKAASSNSRASVHERPLRAARNAQTALRIFRQSANRDASP